MLSKLLSFSFGAYTHGALATAPSQSQLRLICLNIKGFGNKTRLFRARRLEEIKIIKLHHTLHENEFPSLRIT